MHVIFTHAPMKLLDSFLTITYPRSCAICERAVDSRLYGSACFECWQMTKIFDGREKLCWKCGALAGEGKRVLEPELIRCNQCVDQMYEAARACGFYSGALRSSVLELKRSPFIPAGLVTLLLAAARRAPLDQSTCIIPVPLHPDRLQQRGFNQALVIAKAISPRLKLVLDETSLMRVSASPKYRAGLDAKGRKDTVEKAFVVQVPRLIGGERVMLVDDVFTTGSTVSSCASVLLEAGAEKVFVLTIARHG